MCNEEPLQQMQAGNPDQCAVPAEREREWALARVISTFTYGASLH